VPRLFILFIKMIGKVLNDSFQGLRIQIGSSGNGWDQSEPLGLPSVASPTGLGDSLSRLDRECPVGWGRPSAPGSQASSPSSPHSDSCQSQGQQSSRYKTEMCRPFQEHGTCKYGDKCQFAHGNNEVRNVNRHPKYKTDLCRTYHSVGFCPYGPRCHFIHALEEMQKSPERLPEKKITGPIKQLPMYGGPGSPTNDNTWAFPPAPQAPDMAGAVRQLNKYFNANSRNSNEGFNSSGDNSRSGSFCSDVDSNSLPSSSPPPIGGNSPLRLPLFNRLA